MQNPANPYISLFLVVLSCIVFMKKHKFDGKSFSICHQNVTRLSPNFICLYKLLSILIQIDVCLFQRQTYLILHSFQNGCIIKTVFSSHLNKHFGFTLIHPLTTQSLRFRFDHRSAHDIHQLFSFQILLKFNFANLISLYKLFSILL